MSKNLETLKKKRDEAWEKYQKLSQECRNIELSELGFDFEGKFIKYNFWYENQYLYVKEQFKHGDVYVLRGLGFHYEITPYDDNTFFDWDWFEEVTIPEGSVNDSLSRITIVTPDEFKEKFRQGINEMTVKNEEILNKILEKQ